MTRALLPPFPLTPHPHPQDGTPDLSKGSFYFNPTRDSFADVPEDVRKAYPTFFGENIFPAEVADFEPAVRNCARIILDVGALVARQCDHIVAEAHGDFPKDLFERTVRESNHHACRVLHYFAKPGSGAAAPAPAPKAITDVADIDDSWCGWHNDHCTLTGLLPAGYHNDSTGELIANPDPSAGLYIKTRQGETVHVRGPGGEGVLFFQIGETAQIHSGGVLRATPHMVQSVSVPNVSRSTMAIFTEPGHLQPMDMPQRASAAEALRCEHLPPGVPLLAKRWHSGIHFGDFSSETFKSYYKGEPVPAGGDAQ